MREEDVHDRDPVRQGHVSAFLFTPSADARESFACQLCLPSALTHGRFPSSLLSFVFCLLSFVFCLLSFVFCLLSFVFCLLSFVFCLLSFVFCLLSFVFSLLSFVFCLLSFVFCLRLRLCLCL